MEKVPQGKHALRVGRLPAWENDRAVELEEVAHKEVHECVLLRPGYSYVTGTGMGIGRLPFPSIRMGLLLLEFYLVAFSAEKESVVGPYRGISTRYFLKEVVNVGSHDTHGILQGSRNLAHTLQNLVHFSHQCLLGDAFMRKGEIDKDQILSQMTREAELLLSYLSRGVHKRA